LEQQSKSDEPFNAQRYVDSIWNAKLIPALLASAKDIREVGPQTPAGAIAVKGRGRVIGIHTKSAAGMIEVQVDGRPTPVSMQIGPVLRGTSLRDAAGFIRYGDFVNQLQYADAANALNDRVLTTVLSGLQPAKLKGKKISFTGTCVTSSGNIDPVIPIRIQVEEAGS
jgi:predicted lipoprotein